MYINAIAADLTKLCISMRNRSNGTKGKVSTWRLKGTSFYILLFVALRFCFKLTPNVLGGWNGELIAPLKSPTWKKGKSKGSRIKNKKRHKNGRKAEKGELETGKRKRHSRSREYETRSLQNNTIILSLVSFYSHACERHERSLPIRDV